MKSLGVDDERAKPTSRHFLVIIVTNSYHLHSSCVVKHFTYFQFL